MYYYPKDRIISPVQSRSIIYLQNRYISKQICMKVFFITPKGNNTYIFLIMIKGEKLTKFCKDFDMKTELNINEILFA